MIDPPISQRNNTAGIFIFCMQEKASGKKRVVFYHEMYGILLI